MELAGGACLSQGSEPVNVGFEQLEDSGIANRLGKRLMDWRKLTDTKLEIIRPGGFDSSYIRYSGLKAPVLIKGDRFNVSPQMGLTWADVETFSVDLLSELVGGDRTVDTWDVAKQRLGPAWTLSQWCTYWHARQDALARQAARRQAGGGTRQPTVAAINDGDDAEDDGGVDEADSGVVLVLQK